MEKGCGLISMQRGGGGRHGSSPQQPQNMLSAPGRGVGKQEEEVRASCWVCPISMDSLLEGGQPGRALLGAPIVFNWVVLP